jgi:hypothetical protein
MPADLKGVMKYLVVLSFDLHDAESEDYGRAYKELAKQGFERSPVRNGTGCRAAQLPSTTMLRISSEMNTSTAVKNAIGDAQSAFQAAGVKGQVFASAGVLGDWDTASAP